MNEQTHFIWWGIEDAEVGDWFRFDLPNAPCVQVKRAVLVLGKFFEVNDIGHGHRFLITFDKPFSSGRPFGSVHYVKRHDLSK